MTTQATHHHSPLLVHFPTNHQSQNQLKQPHWSILSWRLVVLLSPQNSVLWHIHQWKRFHSSWNLKLSWVQLPVLPHVELIILPLQIALPPLLPWIKQPHAQQWTREVLGRETTILEGSTSPLQCLPVRRRFWLIRSRWKDIIIILNQQQPSY